jgi:predicted permease
LSVSGTPAFEGEQALLDSALQDLRHALRLARSSPALMSIAVASLALGIGVTISMFTLVNAVLLRPVPVESPEELVLLFTGTDEDPYSLLSYPDFLDYRGATGVFRGLAAFGEIQVSLGGEGSPEEIRGAIVSGDFFDVQGVGAALGRVFTPEDDRSPGEHPVAVLSHSLWERRFGGDPGIVGREIAINGRPYVVLGVTPRGFHGPLIFESFDVYVPMMMQAQVRPPRAGFSGEMDPDLLKRRSAGWLSAVGRLAPGASLEQAESSLRAISARLEEEHPEVNRGERVSLYLLTKIDPRAYPILRSIAALLMGVSLLVLLVATANVVNLLLVRAVARRREIAVRLALGGSRARLVRQLVTESLALSLLGGALGLLASSWLLAGLSRLVPATGIFSFTLDFDLDGRVLGFTLLVSVLCAILVGIAPALEGTRYDLVAALRGASGAGSRPSPFGGRNALVLAQIALSVVLLVGAALFVESFRRSSAISPGFAASELLTAELRVELLRYSKVQAQAFYRDVVERAAALPGVEAASLARTVPLAGAGRRTTLGVEGWESRGEELTVATNVVGLDYFRTMGIALLAGRDFAPSDVESSTPVVVANESFAARYFPSGALGKRVQLDDRAGESVWREIVGIVRDSKYRTLGEEPTPYLYQPLAQQHETGVTLFLRGEHPERFVSGVGEILSGLEPNLPLSQVQPLEALLESSLFPARMGARLLSASAILAGILAAVGLYGVVSFAVSMRTREMGIRVALGARPQALTRLVVGEGSRLVVAGVLLGSALALAATRLLSSFLHGVSATEPKIFLGAGVFLSVVMLATAYVPARRASAADPLIALRHD